MENKVAKNFLYNLIYQVVVLIIPLITAPYLARTLGADGIGIYSYNYSIVYFFCLAVMLGINNYGNRAIAKCLGNKERINRTFCEIYSIQFFLGIIVICIYIVYSLTICNNEMIAICYLPFIVSYILDVNWLFWGQENFKIILLRNVVVKVITTIAIFLFIKNSSDVRMYILIMSIGALVSQVIVWPIIFKKHKFVEVKAKDIIRHVKPNIMLFIPVIAVSLYRTMDKIMLGSMSDMAQVGYYEYAEKIVSILLTFITALGTVTLPRMSALYESKNNEQIMKIIGDSFVFVSLVASIVAFGVASIANNLVIVYYGDEYAPSGVLLQLLCITVPLISYANIIRMQILIPQGKDKAYVFSCIFGTIINLVMNAALIPKLQAIGAAIGTIVAEFTVLIIQTAYARKEILIKDYIKSIICFWINSVLMCVCVSLIGYLNMSHLALLLLQIVLGAIVYMVLLFIQCKLLKDKYVTDIINLLIQSFIKTKGKSK